MAKEIDHVLVDGHWRMIQNFKVYRSAQYLNTDHRLVVATLKLQLKSRRMVPSQHRLDVDKLKDERAAEEFVKRLSGALGVWVLCGIVKSCGVPLTPPSLMLPADVLEPTIRRRRTLSPKAHWILLTSGRAKLIGRAELFRELRHKAIHVLRADKEADG